MDVSDATLASIADELKDRLKFSHVILKSTKEQLKAAKESAESEKAKTNRRQRQSYKMMKLSRLVSCRVREDEIKNLKKKFNKQKKNSQQLEDTLHENQLKNEDLELTLTSKEVLLKEAQNTLEYEKKHWERRLVGIYEEKQELQNRCNVQELELRQLKNASKERIVRDEARIKQLTNRVHEMESKLKEREREASSFDCSGHCCRGALMNTSSPRPRWTECYSDEVVSLTSDKRVLETNESNEDVFEFEFSDDCSGCIPQNIADLFISFKSRHFGKMQQALQSDYDELMVDVHTEYEALMMQRIKQHKRHTQRIMRTIRRRHKQREPYLNVVSRDRLMFLKKRLRKCQKKLQIPDSKCSRELRSVSNELSNIANQFERSLK